MSVQISRVSGYFIEDIGDYVIINQAEPSGVDVKGCPASVWSISHDASHKFPEQYQPNLILNGDINTDENNSLNTKLKTLRQEDNNDLSSIPDDCNSIYGAVYKNALDLESETLKRVCSWQFDRGDNSEGNVMLQHYSHKASDVRGASHPEGHLVQRSYIAPDDILEILQNYSGVRLLEVCGEDIYYDTPDFHLMYKNHFLFQRDKKWYLEIYEDQSNTFYNSNNQNYKLISEEEDISAYVSRAIGCREQFLVDFSNFIYVHDFKVFHREQSMFLKYSIFNVSLYLNIRNFGLNECCMEVMNGSENVGIILAKMNQVADKLGLYLFKYQHLTD